MSAVTLLNLYLTANLLLVAAVPMLAGIRALNARVPWRISPAALLRLGYVLLLAVLVLSLLSLPRTDPDSIRAPVQIWSGEDAVAYGSSGPVAQFGSLKATEPLTVAMSHASWVAWAVAGAAVFWFARLTLHILRTTRLVRSATVLRRRGAATVYVLDDLAVPFAFWWPGRSLVVLPASLLQHPRSARLALRHEAQHHRHGDTRSIYALQALRALFFWNPAIHLMVTQILDLHEFACDDAILQRHADVAEDYYQCLVWVAGCVGRGPEAVACAMSSHQRRRMLLRRLTAILAPQGRRLGSLAATMVVTGILCPLAAFSAVMAQPVADRRIVMAEARELLNRASEGAQLAPELNEAVLVELNLLLATRNGMAFVDASLARSATVLPDLREALRSGALPRELLAVPFIESGFQNRPQGENPRHGAGHWMFIASTARRYGLVVDNGADERLHIAKQNDAAVRMLLDLESRYGDWRLALLAYNVGARNLEQVMQQTGSREPWALSERLYRGRINYLARIMAGILILAENGVHTTP
jgi:beta-lactamase regulating signal transducer with metallopeptidase domain